MSDYGVTLFGFRRKPLETIQKEIEDKARKLFGDDADLSVQSPIGLFSKMLAWQSNIIWQELENTYNNSWLDTATGENLSKLVAWGGLKRKDPQRAIIQEQLFIGTPGKTILANTKVETPGGIEFITVENVTIGEDGKAIVSCEAIVAGLEGTVPENSVTVISDPIKDELGTVFVDSTTNKTGSIGGRPEETDEELRARFFSEGVESTGSSPDALRLALLNVPGVQNAYVYENVEIELDDEGRPPKSIECVVLGGEPTEIAQAIFSTKSAGIETYGKDESIQISHNDMTQFIKFSRLNSKYLRVVIEIDPTSDWDENYTSDIVQKTIQYIGGVFTQTIDGKTISTNYEGEITGSFIYPWRIAAANSGVNGIENITVKIGFIEALHGYQTISQLPGPAVTDGPVLANGTYTLQVAINGTDVTPSIVVDDNNNDSWEKIAVTLNDAINPDDTGDAYVTSTASSITITSKAEATDSVVSTIIIVDGSTNGLLAAIGTNGVHYVLNPPEDGIAVSSNKLEIDYRDIARCENDDIFITVNQS